MGVHRGATPGGGFFDKTKLNAGRLRLATVITTSVPTRKAQPPTGGSADVSSSSYPEQDKTASLGYFGNPANTDRQQFRETELNARPMPRLAATHASVPVPPAPGSARHVINSADLEKCGYAEVDGFCRFPCFEPCEVERCQQGYSAFQSDATSTRRILVMAVSFASDIRPLFRDSPDVDSMQGYGLDLSSYADVKARGSRDL